MSEDYTLDRFLGGRIAIAQPRRGFRAGHDTVLLAAAVPAAPDSQMLELGSGAGVASLCLASRVPGARVLGVEIDPELVRIANANAARNGMDTRVRFEAGDAASAPGHGLSFDHVFFNPPFHPASGQESPIAARDLAMRDSANAIAEWTRIALALTKPAGTVTAILRSDRVDDMLAAAEGNSAVLFPLFPRAGEPSKRTIVRLVKGVAAPPHMADGLVLHESDGGNAEAAEAVLRHGAALRLD